ncbi:MAG: MFS transporter [Isosphaeraceae bacterium]
MLHADNASTTGQVSGPRSPLPSRWALTTFVVLFSMNLLDYVDRGVLSAVLPLIKTDLKIDNTQAGFLAFLFLLSYSVFGLFTGWAGDRMKRTYLLALGVGVWSLATVATGFAHTYNQLMWARGFLGIGEATYGVIAPTILMDLFTRDRRARVMSAFYLAMPVGGALGMVLGAAIAKKYGWNMSFLIVGVPGLFMAVVALFLPEPIRGTSEGVDPDRLRAHERAGASLADYTDLMVNSSYTYAVLGMAFSTFAIGGLAYWLPTFLMEARGIEAVRATGLLGLTTLFAAILGMTAGGWLADRMAKTNPRALFVVPGLAMLGSVPFIILGLYARHEVWIFTGIFLAEMLMFVNTGPCNAVIANVVAPNLRAAAYAIAIAAVHFLGDLWSPMLMGWIADTFGQTDTMATSFGRAVAAIGANPIDGQNLLAGMLVVVPAMVGSGLVLLIGARHLPGEMALMLAKLQAVPRSPATGDSSEGNEDLR